MSLIRCQATRLLDVEKHRILHIEGLRPLTDELIQRRLDDAVEEGAISLETAALLYEGPTTGSPSGELYLKAPIPAERVQAIWQPGDLEYDRIGDLPR